jgi:hypothetical protein
VRFVYRPNPSGVHNMPLYLSNMPVSPPYDPAADAEGSADPLGTLAGSERLASVILPGLTARMWRARLLTFTVVAADIADKVVRHKGDQEDLRLAARLAFERMFVSSLVRAEDDDPGSYSGVSRRVPGSRTARRALNVDSGRLTRQNFIKGQAINGPSGVMARLARDLDMVDDDGLVSGSGHDLRSAWAKIAASDDDDEGDAGSDLIGKAVSVVTKNIENGSWPKPGAPLWGMLADSLRPDRIPTAERRIIAHHLHREPEYGLRPRLLQLLRDRRCLAVYQQCSAEVRG